MATKTTAKTMGNIYIPVKTEKKDRASMSEASSNLAQSTLHHLADDFLELLRDGKNMAERFAISNPNLDHGRNSEGSE